MAKKIVILNGSPRENGNTSALVQRFIEGAEQAGNTVTAFFLDRMHINGCKGCFGGHSSQECPCVQKDDMAQIYPAVRDCDVIVLATLLYYWSMSRPMSSENPLHNFISQRPPFSSKRWPFGFRDKSHMQFIQRIIDKAFNKADRFEEYSFLSNRRYLT